MPEADASRADPEPDEPDPARAEQRHLLLTGRPGVGKTTVVRRLAERLGAGPSGRKGEPTSSDPTPDDGEGTSDGRSVPDAPPPPIPVAGFYTEEMREEGERRGFRAVTLPGGERRVIAHEEIEGSPRIGRYGVDVDAVDALSDEALGAGSPARVFLVDEVGKMECLSERFVESVRALLDGGRPVVATVGTGGTEFMDGLRRREDAQLWRVTEDNRNRLPARLERALRKRLGSASG